MVFAKLFDHAACAILLCKYARATEPDSAEVPMSADDGPQCALKDDNSKRDVLNHWIRDLFNSLYDTCRALVTSRPGGPRLVSSADNEKLDRANRVQKMQFVLLFVFSSSNPLDQFRELLPEMSYGAMEKLYEELTSSRLAARLLSYLRKNFKMGFAAANSLCQIGVRCRRNLEKILLTEIRPSTSTPAIETLRAKADVNRPVDAFMILDWHMRQDADPVKGNFAGHLAGVLQYLLTSEDTIGDSLADRIEKYIKPMMGKMLEYHNESEDDVMRCKWLMITCASTIEDDAIFKMFSWSKFREDPKPTAAEFLGHAAIGADRSLHFVINYIHHCFRRDKRDFPMPSDVDDELANYFIEDAPTIEAPDSDEQTRLELITQDPALLSKLNSKTLYRIMEVYCENTMDVYYENIKEVYEENIALYRKRINILAEFLNAIFGCPVKFRYMESLAREKKDVFLLNYIYEVKQRYSPQQFEEIVQ
ncbi:hypothetical protein PAPHI01_1618 [Pancytospora philotis]|nr:hypothetical protein PAPHI01_1618 [Pancytospora philotis]